MTSYRNYSKSCQRPLLAAVKGEEFFIKMSKIKIDLTSKITQGEQTETIRQALQSIQKDDAPEQLADFFAEINAAYFAGRMDTCPIDAQMAARWRQQTGFLPRYIESILLETPKNACEWTSGM